MSITEEIAVDDCATDDRRGPGRRHRRVLLVWDAPNLDMGLGSILGGRPTAAHRPRFDALGRWLLAPHRRAVARAQPDGPSRWSPRPPSSPTSPRAAPTWSGRGWRRCVTWVSRSSPSRRSTKTATSTVDMLDHIALRRSEGLAGVLVASADGQAFRQPLEEIARDGYRQSRCSDFANMRAGR